MRNSVRSSFGSGFRAFVILGMLAAIGTVGFESWTARAQTTRTFRVVDTSAQPGQQVSVPIEVTALGNELAVGFSLNYDPTKLSNPTTSLSPGFPSGTSIGSFPGSGAPGRLGVVIDAISPFPAGTRQLMQVTFTVAANASGSSAISFGNSPTGQGVAISGGALSPATFLPGTVTIGGTPPTPTPTATATPTATPTPIASPTPTATPSASPTPTPVATPTPTPTPTPSPSPTPTPAASPTPNTLVGSDVVVTAPFMNVTFATVVQPGVTTFTPRSAASAGALPSGYTIVQNGPHTDVSTTAQYTGPVTVCFRVFGVDDPEDFARLRILHREGNQLVDRTVLPPNTPAPDFGFRQVCARVDSFSDFYVAFGPKFSVTGRILTPTSQGLRNAVVAVTDSRGVRATATTSSFGVYSFTGLRSGEPYVISVSSKRYRFGTISVVITGNLVDLDFIGLE